MIKRVKYYMDRIRHKKIFLLFLFLIIIMAIGTSLALWQSTFVQNNANIVTSGCFKLIFTEETEAISLNSIYPISDEEGKMLASYDFTIENECSMAANYIINLEVLSGENVLSEQYVKSQLLKAEDEVFIDRLLPKYINDTKVLPSARSAYKLYESKLNGDQKQTFSLRLWMDQETPAEDEVMHKIFEAKITIISSISIDDIPTDVDYTLINNVPKIFLGDSVIKGEKNDYKGVPYYFNELVGNIDANNTVDYSFSGSVISNSITDSLGNALVDELYIGKVVDYVISDSYYKENAQLIILDGGGNDVMAYFNDLYQIPNDLEIGTVDMETTQPLENPNTLIDEFETIIFKLKSNFPKAKILYVNLFEYSWASEEIREKTDIYLKEVEKVMQKYDLNYLDVKDTLKSNRELYMQDDLTHIKEAGYKAVMPQIANKVLSMF